MNAVPFFPLLVIGGILCVVAVVAYLTHLAEKKRTEEMGRVADDLGLSFHPTGEEPFRRSLDGLEMTGRGHGRRLHNLMRGEVGGAAVGVFDYQFTTGGGKNSHTHKQTAVALRLGIELPNFALRPEGFWDKVGSLFGFQDISFEEHPTFNGRYVLKSPEESAVRRVFSDEVLAFFEQRANLCVESRNGIVLFYRPGNRVAPPSVRVFLDEALEMAARLMASAG